MRSQSETAVVHCRGGSPLTDGQEKTSLTGSCAEILKRHPEGVHACRYGCLGGGSCVEACGAHAISWNKNGAATVDRENCTGCGNCVGACPQHLITLEPVINVISVKCSSREAGAAAAKQCANACIGCGICERNRPAGAIHVADHLAAIDPKLCIACGMCASKCPRGAISDANGIFSVS